MMETPEQNRNVFAIKKFLSEYLDLRKDKDNELETVDSIRKGVEFKGANLWILIFAIFMASLGLNVNSTAVIIGAMLISPLMGPIMGVGLSVGLNDFELMKRSLKSFLITTLFSVTTATIFFLVSPVAEGQSELLARTSPTIYDVFIALMGGLAGVVALSTKEKGNVIPGVAIATALMPPLCTAGFGLATGNLLYFLGAFYLYFINSVFISLATFIGVRVMHFQRKEFVDKEREKLVKKYIIFITLATMCPAVYLTYGIVKSTIYEASANNFINEELNFNNTQVIDRKISFEKKEIRVVLIGNEVSETEIATARDNLKLFNLAGTKLVVLQGMNNDAMDIGSIKAQVMEDFYKNSEKRLLEQQEKIKSLENELNVYAAYNTVDKKIIPELKVLYPAAEAIAMAKTVELQVDSTQTDTLTIVLMKFSKKPVGKEQEKISEWLKARVGAKKLKLIVE
jgi:uncharacterized hydrophobic protein (TIGR00271 family)